ncbi:MAG: hypothetical protein QGH45_25465, partial [Myxococcota bacterium]|nr:hypothetical protein [Myxococcota bacterium]
MPTIWRLTILAFLFVPWTGCPTDDDDDDDATGAAPVISDVEAEVSEAVTMVVTVRWTTDVPSTGHVEFGVGDDLSLSTPAETGAATDHEAVLLGLPADADASYRVVAEADGAVAEGELSTITTGPLPPELPNPTVTGSGHDGYMAVPLLGSVSAATILDADGRIVWFRLYEG